MKTPRVLIKYRKRPFVTFSSLLLLVLMGCEVQNPGPIAESSLNSTEAIPGLAVGMSSDLSLAVSQTTYWSSVWADELTHSGTYAAPTIFSTGVIQSEEVDTWRNDEHRARGDDECGIERIYNSLS